jgi:hypothetical protein
MHNGQRCEAVKGARLNLIIKFYDYTGRADRSARLPASARVDARDSRVEKKCIRISREQTEASAIKP